VTPPSLRTWGSGTGMAWRRRWTAASSAPRGWGCSRRYVHMLVQMRASSDSIAAIIVRDGWVCVCIFRVWISTDDLSQIPMSFFLLTIPTLYRDETQYRKDHAKKKERAVLVPSQKRKENPNEKNKNKFDGPDTDLHFCWADLQRRQTSPAQPFSKNKAQPSLPNNSPRPATSRASATAHRRRGRA